MNSENQINNVEPRVSDFGTVKCRNLDFRVNKHQFRQKLVFQLICDLFWVAIVLVCGMLLITEIVQTMGIEIPICGLALASIGISIASIFYRSFLPNMLKISIALFTLFIIAACVLYGVSVPHLTELSLAYSGLQILLTIIFSRQISLIFLKCVLLGQLSLIAAKMDNLIQSDWQLILVPLCIIFMVLIGAASFLMVYTLINQLFLNQPNIITKFGLISLSLTLLSFALQASIPLIWAFITPNIIIPASLAIFYHIVIIVYGSIFQVEIALFMCTGINRVSNNPEEPRNVSTKIQNKDETLKLYRVSENWFVSQMKEVNIGNQIIAYSKQQCLICMTEESTMVWMPCGHLAVCQKCSCYLIQNCKPICVLCKRKCEFIHKIKIVSQNIEEIHRIRSHQDYGIQYTQQINNQ